MTRSMKSDLMSVHTYLRVPLGQFFKFKSDYRAIWLHIGSSVRVLSVREEESNRWSVSSWGNWISFPNCCTERTIWKRKRWRKYKDFEFGDVMKMRFEGVEQWVVWREGGGCELEDREIGLQKPRSWQSRWMSGNEEVAQLTQRRG